VSIEYENGWDSRVGLGLLEKRKISYSFQQKKPDSWIFQVKS